MHHPTDRITHTTAFVTPVVEHWLERDTFIDDHYLSVEQCHVTLSPLVERVFEVKWGGGGRKVISEEFSGESEDNIQSCFLKLDFLRSE